MKGRGDIGAKLLQKPQNCCINAPSAAVLSLVPSSHTSSCCKQLLWHQLLTVRIQRSKRRHFGQI